eukprot:TRINITY_DN6929_c0_g1_i1.p1 TRINITY_DN6929_c0_g1~~TRINITY_DN6929_c0_g1_i1.p1  ORF type:complete len:1095 (-),score=163.12 TRINITY_DN6929_c0_g1_i1:62-3346(-)
MDQQLQQRTQLINLCRALLTSDNDLRRNAMNSFDLLCRQPGFALLILNLVQDKQLEEEIRLMAVLQLKGLLRREWNRRDGVLSSGERMHIQELLVSELLDEPQQKISNQIDTILADVVDHDYPKYWPDFFSKIINFIQDTNSPRVRLRGFQALDAVIRDLTSREDRNRVKTVASHLISFIGAVYVKLASDLGSVIGSLQFATDQAGNIVLTQNPSVETMITAELTNLTLRILHHLIVRTGYLKDHGKEPVIADLTPKLLELWKAYCRIAQVVPTNVLTPFVFKHIIRLGKFASEAEEEYPRAFQPYIVPFLEFVCTQIVTFPHGKLPDMFIIYSMIFLYAVLQKRRDATSNSELYNLTQGVFTREVISQLSGALILSFFPITQVDLVAWEHNGEAMVTEEIKFAWRTHKRACAEMLFGCLIRFYPATVCPVIGQLIKEMNKETQMLQGQVVPMEFIQRKDAIYYAIGLGNHDLTGRHIVFPTFLQTHLIPDMQNPDSRYRILRRRVAFVIELWSRNINRNPNKALVKTVYEMLFTLLADQDVVVRLAAAVAIRVIIEDNDFHSDIFIEYIEAVTHLIFKMVADTKTVDCHMQLVKLVHVMIMHMGEQMDPFLPKLLDAISALWQSVDLADNMGLMLQSSIVRTMSVVVKTNGPRLAPLLPYFITMVAHSVDIQETRSFNLLEDGLALWYTLLRFTPCSPELQTLFKSIGVIIEYAQDEELDIRRQVLRIIEAYVLLAGQQFLVTNLTSILSAANEMMNGCCDAAQHRIFIRIANSLLLMYHKDVAGLLVPVLEHLMRCVLADPERAVEGAATSYSQLEEERARAEKQMKIASSQPKGEDAPPARLSAGNTDAAPASLTYDDINVQYFAVFARLIVTDTGAFMVLLQRVIQTHTGGKTSTGEPVLPQPFKGLPRNVDEFTLMYLFIERMLVTLAKMYHALDDNTSTYRRTQEARMRKLMTVALCVLFCTVLPGMEKQLFASGQTPTAQLQQLHALHGRLLCTCVNVASALVIDWCNFSAKLETTKKSLELNVENMVEKTKDELATRDQVDQVDIVQFFAGKVTELASTTSLLSRDQLMSCISPALLMQLQQQQPK